MQAINQLVGYKDSEHICVYGIYVYLQTHSDMLAGAWQEVGRFNARVALNLIPRLGSSRSLMSTQRHFLLFCKTCLIPVQQSKVGALASPPT